MPTTFPEYALTDLDIDPDLGTAFARTQGGLIITSRDADPFYRGTMSTRPLSPWGENNEHADFLAWLIWCCDFNMRVDFVHPRHKLPRAYSAGGWPMTGNGSLVSTPDQRTLRVQSIPAGVVLKRGDRIAVRQGDLIVHRWIAVDTIVSSEIAQDIPVTPRLPIGVLAPGALVVLQDPPMRFMIVPNSWDAAEAGTAQSISFDIMEAFR